MMNEVVVVLPLGTSYLVVKILKSKQAVIR
jgi:hypothetical protein